MDAGSRLAALGVAVAGLVAAALPLDRRRRARMRAVAVARGRGPLTTMINAERRAVHGRRSRQAGRVLLAAGRARACRWPAAAPSPTRRGA